MDKIQTTDCYVANSNPPDGLSIAIYDSVKNITVWLQNKEGVIVLTVEQANKVFGEIWDAAHKREHEWNQYYYFEDTTDEKYRAMPDKETYIKSLLP